MYRDPFEMKMFSLVEPGRGALGGVESGSCPAGIRFTDGVAVGSRAIRRRG